MNNLITRLLNLVICSAVGVGQHPVFFSQTNTYADVRKSHALVFEGFDNFELVEYLEPGETAQFKKTPYFYEGVEIPYAEHYYFNDALMYLQDSLDSTDQKPYKSLVTELDEDYTFKALNKGKVLACFYGEATEETYDVVEKEWPYVDFYTYLSGGSCSTIYITDQKSVFSLYSPSSGQRLYTTNKKLYQWMSYFGWKTEGNQWLSDKTAKDSVGVHQLFSPFAADQLYSANQQEIDYLKSIGWKDDGIAFYVLPLREDTA